MQQGTSSPSVVYIAGWGRSGSTLLNRVLAGPDVVGAGEVRWLWERGVLGGEDCSCGRSWDACDAWGPVVRELAAERGLGPRELAAAMHRDGTRTRRRVALGLPLGSAGQGYVDGLRALYRALATATGASTIVDSSKDPAQALLARRTGLAVTVVHLVRDPRAVAWSHQRAKAPPAGAVAGTTPRRPAAYVSVRWLVRNLFLEARGRADLRLRYEDLIDRPSEAVEAILGRDAAVEDRHGHHHVIAGNPDRFDRGPLRLRPDTEWVRVQPRSHKAVATAVALPLLGRYGYRLRS